MACCSSSPSHVSLAMVAFLILFGTSSSEKAAGGSSASNSVDVAQGGRTTTTTTTTTNGTNTSTNGTNTSTNGTCNNSTGHTVSLSDFYYDYHGPACQAGPYPDDLPLYLEDIDLLQFAQNVEHLEADFFLWGALGFGLDVVAPELVYGGPPPVGVRKANLDPLTESIIKEFSYEEVGHLRALKSTVGGIPRPFMNLSAPNFARFIDQAFGYKLQPRFDPYHNSLNYMLASYIIPYIGLTGYVGANPLLRGHVSLRLTAGLLGVESGQDAVIRFYLYERADELVEPYNFTVAEATDRISNLRNILGKCGIKDEGIVVPPQLGAEGKTSTNVLSSNRDELSYQRTPAEILRVLYETGDEHVPCGFYPRGANGRIARQYIRHHDPHF